MMTEMIILISIIVIMMTIVSYKSYRAFEQSDKALKNYLKVLETDNLINEGGPSYDELFNTQLEMIAKHEALDKAAKDKFRSCRLTTSGTIDHTTEYDKFIYPSYSVMISGGDGGTGIDCDI